MEIHLEFKPAHSVARFCTGIHVQLSVLTDVTLGVLGTPGPPPPLCPIALFGMEKNCQKVARAQPKKICNICNFLQLQH